MKARRIAPALRRLAGRASLAFGAVLLCLAGAARAESGQATDTAFGALLAMPGAQPRDGGWVIPQEPATSETDLIAWLRELKKEGANFNAVRHGGTLLAHAIRAGKEEAAIWLLRNGADPAHVRVSGVGNAHDLAVRYKRTRVAAVLEQQYGFKPRPPVVPKPAASRPAATPASASPAAVSREQAAEELVARLASRPVPDEASQRQWRAFAATLSQDEYREVFRNGEHIDSLVRLTRNIDGALEEALSRLPRDLVRQKAQDIANLLMEFSFFSYRHDPNERPLDSSISWPALWKRIDQPLRYDAEPDLAGRVSPALWSGLFASGYAEHDAAATGCLLGAADPASFQALWPDFQRYFANAREEAAGLVLGKYRLGGDYYPCYNDSGHYQTVAKLAFLKQQGVSGPVTGLRRKALEDAQDPALTAMATSLAPRTPAEPRLVQAPLHCKLVLDEMLLDALVRAATEDANIPADRVQAIAVPGHDQCGWVVGGDTYADDATDSDDFFDGPFSEGSTRCADLPDELSVWVRGTGGLHPLEREPLRDGSALTAVRDQATSKQYLLTDGKKGSRCSVSYGLPGAYEWRDGPDGPSLQPGRDGFLLRRLLRAQCEEIDPSDPSAGVACRGMASQDTPDDAVPVAPALQAGRALSIDRVVDWLGSARRQDYAKAIAGHDHAALGSLLAQGLPTRWTADEIRSVGKSTLPLEEKRRRIALLFANPEQLARAMFSDRFELPESLLPWLPDQDWGPVLRVIERSPDLWRSPAAHLRETAETAGRPGLACAIDHAQGFLCGGGIVPN